MASPCPCCGLQSTTFLTEPTPHHFCTFCEHRWHLPDHQTTSESYYAQLVGRNVLPDAIVERKLDDRLTSLRKLARDNMEILEIGCAEGTLGARLKKLIHVTYTGIELSRDAATAASVLDHVIKQPSGTLRNQQFDLIISFHVLEHITDIRSEVACWHRLLRESGNILIEVPNKAGHPLLDWDANSEHIHQFSPQSLLLLFQQCGFQALSLTCGHFESPVYSDSIRLIACHQASSNAKKSLLADRFCRVMCGSFAVYGIGGDFNNYVLPFINELPVTALIDSDPEKRGKMVNGFPVSSLESVTDSNLPILIASIRYKDDITKTLKAKGMLNRTVGLDEIYGD